MRKTAALIITLVLLSGCGNEPTPTPTFAPPPIQPAGPTSTPIPPAPASLTIDDHRKAMRAGFEDEADDYANGLHYWVTLDVKTEPVRVTGHEKIHYINKTTLPLNDIVFRLFLNGLDDKPLQSIDGVRVGGVRLELESSPDGSVVTATLPRELMPDESMDFELDFSMTMDSGADVTYGRVLDVDGQVVLSSFLPLVGVYGADGWIVDAPVAQGDPAFSETALFDIQLTTPSEYLVATTGVVLGETENDDGTTLRAIATGPVRDYSVAIDKTFEKLSNTRDGITVNIWGTSGRSESDQAALAMTEASLSVFNQKYGPYPFNEIDVIESPISAGGIEYPGLIYVAQNVWDPRDGFFEVVVSHEVAHQWWYSTVGNDQINQPWVDESLANYSVIVYYETEYGDQAGNAVRDNFQERVRSYLTTDGSADLPVGLPVAAYDEQQYGAIVYNKGPLFYSKLADDYGDEAVFKLLQTYYIQYRYRVARTTDLQRLVTEMFGDDAREMFDEMVMGQQ
jgi:hypothetical protein